MPKSRVKAYYRKVRGRKTKVRVRGHTRKENINNFYSFFYIFLLLNRGNKTQEKLKYYKGGKIKW